MYTRNQNIFGVPWNKLFSLNIIQKQKILFDETINSYEDELFVLKYLLFASSVFVSSACTYNYHIREQLSLSKKYIEINQHINIANRLNELASKFSSENIYTIHLRNTYSRHLCESITRLYNRHTHYNRRERLEIIKTIIETAKEHNVSKILYSQLQHSRFYSHNVFMIDINGILLSIYRYLKRTIKRIL